MWDLIAKKYQEFQDKRHEKEPIDYVALAKKHIIAANPLDLTEKNVLELALRLKAAHESSRFNRPQSFDVIEGNPYQYIATRNISDRELTDYKILRNIKDMNNPDDRYYDKAYLERRAKRLNEYDKRFGQSPSYYKPETKTMVYQEERDNKMIDDALFRYLEQSR